MTVKAKWNDNWFFHDGDIEILSPQSKGPSVCGAKTVRSLAGPFSVNFPDRPNNRVEPNDKKELAMVPFDRVRLPHDYIITQTPSAEHNEAIGGVDYHPAWYRKHYTFSGEDVGKRLVLYFEGIADHATVYFNGVYMLDHLEAHTPFEIDVTDFVNYDEDNVLAIRVESGTGGAWWYQGGGIYRNVWLEKRESVSVNRYGIYVHPEKRETDWLVPVETEVRNDTLDPVTVMVETAILDENDEVLLSMKDEILIPDREVKTLKQQGTVENPSLWDMDSPRLHRVRTRLLVNGEVTDEEYTTFGFREIAFSAEQGFFLNGKNVKLKGVCAHGDCGLTGIAVEESIHRYRARLIKEMGANAFRCSHYPHAEAFMDELDRLGIVSMNEVRWFSSAPHGIKELETLVRRDRNRPGVIMWSIGNEEPLFMEDRGRRIAAAMCTAVKKLDPTRPITAAVDRKPENATVYDYCDIIGINYNYQSYEPLRERFPNKPIIASEHSATGTTRGWYAPNVPALGRISAYDHDTDDYFKSREFYWQFICDRPWIMGGMQWIAFDFRGSTGWPRLCSVAGAIDMYLQKKDAFYQNQSFFTDEPMIHLLPHWNRQGEEGETVKVYAYTNCDTAELFLNGESLGRMELKPVQHAEWDVVYHPGTLEAVGYKNGEIVARDAVETTKAPVRLVLRAENADDAAPHELIALTCFAVDEDGREVKNAEIERISFYADEGATVVATGSDNTDPIPPHITERRMYGGRVSVLVRLSAQGTATVYAKSFGLKGGKIHVTNT